MVIDAGNGAITGIIYKNVVDSADEQFQIDNIKHDDLPIASFKANYVPYDALFSGIARGSFGTLEEACSWDENCKGINPETNTMGYASEASVANAYPQAKRMERHHLEMYNTRNYMVYHTGSVHDATMRYKYGSTREFLINNDDFDVCKGLCENYAMNYDDVAEGSDYYPTRWFHQTLLDYAGRYICRCQPDPTLECPSGSIMHTNGEQKLGTLQSFREQEHAGTLATLWTSFPKTVPDFPTNHQSGIWDVVCEGCPMGTYASALTSGVSCYYTFSSSCQKTACAPCPDGYYNDQIGQTECTKKCPAGRFYSDATRKANTALWGQAECTVCAAGEYQNEEGKGACKTCSAGSITGRTGTGAPTCTACAAGKYSTASNVASCTTCAAGKYASSGSSSCTNCVPGKYSGQTGQAGCTICPIANYQDQTGKTSCKECPAGRWAYVSSNRPPASHDSLNDCQLCWAGRYSSVTSLSYHSFSDDKCTTCAAGKYASSTGSSSCTTCAAGKYASWGSSSCTNCAAGKYASSGSSSCTNCAAGKYASSSGSSSCTECEAGKYNTETGSSTATKCKTCLAGKYSWWGASSCTSCPAGKGTKSPGSISIAYCGDCPAMYSGSGGSSVTPADASKPTCSSSVCGNKDWYKHKLPTVATDYHGNDCWSSTEQQWRTPCGPCGYDNGYPTTYCPSCMSKTWHYTSVAYWYGIFKWDKGYYYISRTYCGWKAECEGDTVLIADTYVTHT
jgi:hypothetical protein